MILIHLLKLFRYREAGAEVIDCLMKMGLQCCVERASIDEAYLDLTGEVDKRMSDGFGVTADRLPNTIIAQYKPGREENDQSASLLLLIYLQLQND